MKIPPGPQCSVCGREYPALLANSSASIVCTTRGRRGSGLVSNTYVRDDLIPGTIRYRRSNPAPGTPCSPWPGWHNALEQAFQPKWCNSLPAVGNSHHPTTEPYSGDDGSQSTTVIASLTRPAGSNAATYARRSGGAAIASAGLR
jgi:hypothetical protein